MFSSILFGLMLLTTGASTEQNVHLKNFGNDLEYRTCEVTKNQTRCDEWQRVKKAEDKPVVLRGHIPVVAPTNIQLLDITGTASMARMASLPTIAGSSAERNRTHKYKVKGIQIKC